MSEHTKEPMGFGKDNDGWYVRRGDVRIAHGLTEEDARRIVACVNACAGIPTGRLEAGAADILAYSMELKQQRDELLEALQGADVLFAHHCKDATAANWLDSARAAIARAEGTKQ